MKYSNSNTHGHVLVILLFFMVMAVTVITASVSLMIINSSSSTKYISGNRARTIAESGIENALIRLLRDPDYTGENDLTIGEGTADITVTGELNKTVTSTGEIDGQIKIIEVGIELNGNTLTINYWKEIT